MAWYESRKGWVTVVIGVFSFIVNNILDPWERGHAAISIYHTLKASYLFLERWIALIIFLVAILFFERQRRQRYDLRTLKGITLKVRDEMQAFLNSLSEPATTIRGRGNDPTIHHIERLHGDISRREALLENAFYLKFEGSVRKVWREFGVLGIQDRQLTEMLGAAKFEQTGTWLFIIEALSRLSKLSEADERLFG